MKNSLKSLYFCYDYHTDQKQTNKKIITEMISAPTCKGSLKIFYVNTTHKAAHWIRKPYKGRLSVKTSKVLIFFFLVTIMHAPEQKWLGP